LLFFGFEDSGVPTVAQLMTMLTNNNMARSESRAIPTPQLEIYKLNELTDSL